MSSSTPSASSPDSLAVNGQSTLELALIGNCMIGGLIDCAATLVWSCWPRLDGVPVFCSLLRRERDCGFFAIELIDCVKTEQFYIDNTAILVTRLTDARQGVVEITDFAPRFGQYRRMFHPAMLVRQIHRCAGSPRIRIRLRPVGDYGLLPAEITWGSHHIRYVMGTHTLRLTTDASITAILQETVFFLEEPLTLLLGPDETVTDNAHEIGRRFLDETMRYWGEWVRSLAIPFEWQKEVIRAAITLKLNAFDDTGAIIAAMTTSIPESANSGRNWDYRCCWLRDGFFVVNALNRLGATRTLERFLSYVINVAAEAGDAPLQPVYGIDGRADLTESIAEGLPGYRGMGPVRIGNQACNQIQHDVYGAAILAATHVFFDRRLARQGDIVLFHHLESLGERAVAHFDQPDAGLWELRGRTRVHTFSSVMCWAACDRLARIARQLGLTERAHFWTRRGRRLKTEIIRQTWNPERGSFVAAFGAEDLDASLLLLAEIGFVSARDKRYIATVDAIDRELRRGDYIFRYVVDDDFGAPQNAFLVCTFWYINALVAIGRREEARELFNKLLAHANRIGLFAEHIDPTSGEQWGNFVQTYSMVGVITVATRLSKHWDQAF